MTISQESNRTAIVGGILGNVEGEFIKLRDFTCTSEIEINAQSAKAGGLFGQINKRTVLNLTSETFVFDGKITQFSTNP